MLLVFMYSFNWVMASYILKSRPFYCSKANQYIFLWYIFCWFFCLMAFDATFNNIAVIARPVLLVDKTEGPGGKPLTCRKWLINSITMLYISPWSRLEITTSVVIGTDCICSCKSNYHAITITKVPLSIIYLHVLNTYLL